MNTKQKHLYISDLDGTLLGPDSLPSAESVELLNRMMDDGLQFTVASARNVLAIRRVLPGVRLTLPVIELNGSFLTDPNTGKHIMRNTLPAQTARPLLRDMHSRDIFPTLNAWGGQAHMYYHRLNNPAMEEFIAVRRRQNDPRLRDDPDFFSVISHEEVICFSMLDKAEKLEEFYAYLNEKYAGRISPVLYREELSGGYRQLSIYAHDAQKSIAIEKFAQLYGYRSCDVTVFGDDTNDLPMFRWAGRAVAMGNAVDAVKAAADIVAGPNDQSTVARFIRDEFYAD